MQRNPKYRTFIENKVLKGDFPNFVNLDEKKRYLGIMKTLGEKFSAEHEIGNELLQCLKKNDSIKQRIEESVQKDVDCQVAERTAERCKQIDIQVQQKNEELTALRGTVQSKEKRIAELNEEIEYLDALKEETADNAGDQLLPILEMLEANREKIIQDYIAIEPLIRRLNRPAEAAEVLTATTGHSDKHSNRFVPPQVSQENAAALNDHKFVEKRLHPYMACYGIKCQKHFADKLHRAVRGCRFVLVPDERWGVAYAEACGGQLLIENVQPDWYSLSRAASPLLVEYWKAALKHPESLYFLMFEGVNRCPVSSWIRPWSNVAAELTEHVVLQDDVLPWPDNIRIFLTTDKTATKFEADSLFFHACGTFCSAGEDLGNDEVHSPPAAGHVSVSQFKRKILYPSISLLGQLPDNYDPIWRRAASNDIQHIANDLFNAESAAKIRVQWPMSYATVTGAQQR